ncbi:MAG: TonB-dependent receptor [Parvularculaceae bacterium]|nr:MAG: TonB-dependent receptor [Parvularculaceae bacterium]
MRKDLVLRASFIAIGCAIAAPQQAMAQSATQVLSDEILVTGTKKKDAENVQDVPLAVTAYGAEQLDVLKVRDLQSLTTSVPNVSFDDIGTTRGVANFSIRGIGINSSIPSIDPTVGVFKDGIYLGTNTGVVLDIFDLESVEVLRGPQGILFGRNVTGGAVLLNYKRPDFGGFSAEFKGSVESGLRSTGENYYAMGAVSGPVIEDVLAVRISAYYNKDNGYHRRYLGGPTPNTIAEPYYTAALGSAASGAAIAALVQGPGTDDFTDFGRAETWIIRPSATMRFGENVELYVSYEHFDSEGDGPAAQNHLSGAGSSNVFFTADRDDFDFSIDNDGFYISKADQLTAELTIDVDFGDGQIVNVFGWRDTSGENAGDIDATPLFLFHSGTETEQDQISNEIRYNGRFGAFDVTTGFYYFTQDLAYTESRAILGGFQNFSGGGRLSHDVVGLFGQVDYDINDELVFTAGGRWTREEKDAEIANIRANGNISTTVFGVPGCGVVDGSCPVDFADSESWSNFTPKIGLTWTPGDAFNMYAHWTQGVRSGGYNFRNTSTTVFNPGPWDEENVNAFEVGFKAQPGNGRAVINAAVYWNDINGMQREINLPDPVTGVVQIIDNTADATIRGFEVEGRFSATDNLLFTGFVGYTDGRYDNIFSDLSGTSGVIDQDDFNLEIPRLVPWTVGAGFVHTMTLTDSMLVNTRANYSHRGESFYTDNNLGTLNELNIIDASITLSLMDGQANLSLYGKNLLHEVNHGGDTQLPASLGGGTFSPLTKGRIVGLELQLKI